MSGFFTAPASQRKRKRVANVSSTQTPKKRATAASKSSLNRSRSTADGDGDESVSGSDSALSDAASPASQDGADSESSNESEFLETAAERRLKLAERYLDNIREDVERDHDVGFDAEEIDRELIAARLKEDVAEDKGRVYRHIARELDYSAASHVFFRADTLTTTGVAACPPYVYTVSKDMRLIKWQLNSPRHVAPADFVSKRRKPKQLLYTRGNKNRSGDPSYQHHTASILCVAASFDGKFVVTGGADRRLIVWDAETLKPLKVFTQHRDAVTGLAFRGKTNQLFSSSKDRTVKIWSLDNLAYVETLFGHQDEVVDVSAVGGPQERCVSVGARDRTARLWKVVEESQLVFRGGGGGGGSARQAKIVKDKDDSTLDPHIRFTEGSLDRVVQLDAQLFVTGSDSGSLSLFSLHKKKPLHVMPVAHGSDPAPSAELTSAEMDTSDVSVHAQPTPRWVTALKAIPFSDLFLSGSWDGIVRVWRIASANRDDVEDKSRNQGKIEPVAILKPQHGEVEASSSIEIVDSRDAGNTDQFASSGTLGAENGTFASRERTTVQSKSSSEQGHYGIINDLAVFERGDRGRDGICVVAAVGAEPRLGRWMKCKGKNGMLIFEVPRLAPSTKTRPAVNGSAGPH